MNPIDLIRLQITLEYTLNEPGRLVLYSYKTENFPSQALARSLGAVWYAESGVFWLGRNNCVHRSTQTIFTAGER